MKTSSIKIQVKSLPSLPGVYQFFNKEGGIIYIGKAKNLKKRATSYFTKTHDNNRVKLLVKNIDRIETIVVVCTVAFAWARFSSPTSSRI